MKMMFKDLYLFSPHEKAGRKISFEKGINVITSSQEDGTDRGKSVVMRSLYHALGAEALFEKKWDARNKIYILKFAIDDAEYYIYRTGDLFKFFDADKSLLFKVTRSYELARHLQEYTHFSVQLPGRQDRKLEITPPVYNYLPFFLDQDHYDGSNFASFAKLGQYENIKDYVLFYHFGAYDENYFALVRDREDISDSLVKHEHRLEILNEMQIDIEGKMESGPYASNMAVLSDEVEIYRREYSEVLMALNKSKMKLVELRNSTYELDEVLEEINHFSKKNENEINRLQKHICPECGSTIIDTLSLKSKRYNLSEDIILVKNDLQVSLLGMKEELEKEENKYRCLLNDLAIYEEKLKINTKQVSDILRHKGLCEIRDGIISERREIQDFVEIEEDRLTEIGRHIKVYGAKKKKISDKYYQLLISARDKFGLNEIDPDKFKSVKTNFSASGSNKNIATVIWYVAVMKLRKEFNPKAIEFPVVFDSPNNVETDNVKKHALLQYILDNTVDASQLILSSIGFNPCEFVTDEKINLITLENAKYQLLDEQTYLDYSDLLNELCDAEKREV